MHAVGLREKLKESVDQQNCSSLLQDAAALTPRSADVHARAIAKIIFAHIEDFVVAHARADDAVAAVAQACSRHFATFDPRIQLVAEKVLSDALAPYTEHTDMLE